MDLEAFTKRVLIYIKEQAAEIVKLIWTEGSEEPKGKYHRLAEHLHNRFDNIVSLLLCAILLSLIFVSVFRWILGISMKKVIAGKVIYQISIKDFLFNIPLVYQIILIILLVALLVWVLRLLVSLVKFVKTYHVTSLISLIIISFWLIGIIVSAYKGNHPSEILREHGIKLLLKTLGVDEG